MSDEPARGYFDARAKAFDALYDLDRGVRGLLYRPLRRRLEWTLQECREIAGARVLDVGCGSGRYAVALAGAGAQVTGIDISPTMLSLARARAEHDGVIDRCTFAHAPLEELPVGPRWDVVIAIGLLDYIADPASFVSQLATRSSDRVIVSYPPRAAWRSHVRSMAYALRPRGVGFHAHRQGEIEDAFRAEGAEVVARERGWLVARGFGSAE